MTVSAYWAVSNNFGDLIGPYLIEKMTGHAPIYAEAKADYRHYVFGGSILNHVSASAVVWGAGLGTITDGVNVNAKLCAVRGPISRARALSLGADCPAIYGDPGLALPKFYTPKPKEKHAVGIVPHYVDQFRAHDRYKGCKIIDVFKPIEEVIDDISSCSLIYSSSLHGIIVAHAYGIPAMWIQISDSICGDKTKYRDYYASVGMDVPHPADCRENGNLPAFSAQKPKIDVTDFMAACPLNK